MLPTKPTKSGNRWYPSKDDFPDERHFNAIRIAYDNLYDLQDRVEQQRGELSVLQASHAQRMAKNSTGVSVPNTVSSTHLNGILIKAVPPKDGQKLVYNAKTGQAEWTT
jgi:hypothetical protein